MVKLNDKNAAAVYSGILPLAGMTFPATVYTCLGERTARALGTLDHKQQLVLDLGHGLSGETLSTRQIAQELGTPREDVREISEKALRALYCPSKN